MALVSLVYNYSCHYQRTHLLTKQIKYKLFVWQAKNATFKVQFWSLVVFSFHVDKRKRLTHAAAQIR